MLLPGEGKQHKCPVNTVADAGRRSPLSSYGIGLVERLRWSYGRSAMVVLWNVSYWRSVGGCGTDALRMPLPGKKERECKVSAISYAMSGTNIAFGVIRLRACYAMSGTDVASGARCRLCYVMSGTEIGYAATRSYCPNNDGIPKVRLHAATPVLRHVRK
eukprot:431673-Rhodomonas_salina.2